MGRTLKNSYDVVIAGAGPAGSALANRLALLGRTVLIVEKSTFPREKLCGEFISPECASHFAELGVLPAISSQSTQLRETVFYSKSGRSISVESEWFGAEGSIAFGLSRAQMDTALLVRASDVGADVVQHTAVVGLLQTDNTVSGVRIRDEAGMETEIAANLMVDATGRSRILARKIEGVPKASGPATHVAFKTHLRGALIKPGACEIYSYPGGYGGCNAVEDGSFNVCFVVSAKDAKRLSSEPERVMREVVFNNPRARTVMETAEVAKPWLAVPIQRFGRGTLVPASGLVTDGDSAAFIDPFTGSGILLALQSAKILSSVISDTWGADMSELAREYQKRYSAAFDERLRWCSMIRHASFNTWTAELMVVGLGMSTPLRKGIARLTR